jgi:aspartyl-tRNA(Asn)/glutamyl-tRNA(Gln) amidotransferase subunit B
MIDAGKLSSTNAKMLLDDIGEDEDPEKVAENRGLIQMSDSGEMEAIVSQVLNDNPKPTDDVKNGEMKAIGFLVGQVMKASGGKANPSEVLKIIRDKLGV